jgi:GMP synthase-like glutamine amidotransferase
MTSTAMRTVFVLQHTHSEFLGLIEDHLEGRSIRFTYMRPFASGGFLPASVDLIDGVFLLGGGPWGAAGGNDLPRLYDEVRLTVRCLELGKPVVGFGLGAQILAIAGGGRVEPAPFRLEVGEVRRTDPAALNGFLPERFPQVVCMRDRPVPPFDARVLAVDAAGRPAVFQVGNNSLGFCGHPGAKLGMIEDLAMEFDEAPEGLAEGLEKMREVQSDIADALVRIMTGVIQITGLMRQAESAPPR